MKEPRREKMQLSPWNVWHGQIDQVYQPSSVSVKIPNHMLFQPGFFLNWSLSKAFVWGRWKQWKPPGSQSAIFRHQNLCQNDWFPRLKKLWWQIEKWSTGEHNILLVFRSSDFLPWVHKHQSKMCEKKENPFAAVNHKNAFYMSFNDDRRRLLRRENILQMMGLLLLNINMNYVKLRRIVEHKL